jgi:hypothetical protein
MAGGARPHAGRVGHTNRHTVLPDGFAYLSWLQAAAQQAAQVAAQLAVQDAAEPDIDTNGDADDDSNQVYCTCRRVSYGALGACHLVMREPSGGPCHAGPPAISASQCCTPHCMWHLVAGEMIACDNPDCPVEWFHLGCVGLTSQNRPRGKWFCPECRAVSGSEEDGDYRRMGSRKRTYTRLAWAGRSRSQGCMRPPLPHATRSAVLLRDVT